MASISKSEFVAQLGELLKNADMNVEGLALSEDGDKVLVHFPTARKLVNVECDSYGALALDVIRAALY